MAFKIDKDGNISMIQGDSGLITIRGLNPNKNAKERVNNNLIKNINKFLDNKFTYDLNKNNQEFVNFIKSQKNIINKENKEKRMELIDSKLLIDNYLNNPDNYPFPIEQLMNKFNENK